MFLCHALSNPKSYYNSRMSLKMTISRTLLLLSVVLVLSNGSPIPDPSTLLVSESVHKRSASPLVTDDGKICYPKMTADKITQLTSGSSKSFHDLTIIKLTIDNSEQTVGVLPETVNLMFNEELSQCITRSTIMHVPGIFPDKLLVTECDTSCSALSDSNVQLYNGHIPINVLKRTSESCNGKEEDWGLHNVKIPQCRKLPSTS